MQEGSNAKQLIVERIKQSTSILVAVSANPSVDALSAALGLALMLNKQEKHTTAVFSGAMPPAMAFLEPNKTFESSVDALRDFIISLDKEKADRLRYKVEDDVVRIFITPYRTTITEKDLQFSQGDFNVDLIVALGVEKREELDKTIVAHGRILHDATVVTINANNQRSSLGAVDWHDSNASSLCEMLVSMSESFQQPGLLDTQISTALLTGIVAATERFSNQHTTPRVMTMAAQLMAAGANQQLIATQLRQAHEIPDVGASIAAAGATSAAAPSVEPVKKKADGELDIVHDSKDTKKKPAQPQQSKQQKQQPQPKKQVPTAAEQQLAAAIPPPPQASANELKQAIEADTKAATQKGQPPQPTTEPPKAPGSTSVNGGDEDQPQPQTEASSYLSSHGSWKGRKLEPPTLGGTLNATAEQALSDAKQAEEQDRNQMLLAHPDDVAAQAPLAPTPTPPQSKSAPKSEPPKEPVAPPEPPAPSLPPQPPVQEPPAPQPAIEPYIPPPPAPPAEQSAAPAPMPEPPTPPVTPEADLDAARLAVDSALQSQAFDPARQPLESIGAQPLPGGESLPPQSNQSVTTAQPAVPDMPPNLPPLPPLPPMPPLPQSDATGPAPLPPAPDLPGLHDDIQTSPPPPQQSELDQPNTPQNPSDPGQFKIPGA